MLEFHQEWSPDASAVTPRGQMEVPLRPQLQSSEMPAGNAGSVLQEHGAAGTARLHRSALTCSRAKSGAWLTHALAWVLTVSALYQDIQSSSGLKLMTAHG